MFLSYSKAARQSVFVRVVWSPDHENMGPLFSRGSGGGRRSPFREGKWSCIRRMLKPERRWGPQERGRGHAHWHEISGLQHPSRRQCLHDVCSMLVRSPSSILVSSMPVFRCLTKLLEVGSRFTFTFLISFPLSSVSR